jgi:hypothetical protein
LGATARDAVIRASERSDFQVYPISFVVAAYANVTPRPGKGTPHAQAVADAD